MDVDTDIDVEILLLMFTVISSWTCDVDLDIAVPELKVATNILKNNSLGCAGIV